MQPTLVPSLVILALCTAPLSAETIKVPQDFETIQEAVNAAASGDIVLVAKGTYREHVTIGTAGIALRGKSGATIDGTYTGTCVVVEADDVEVSGLTLVNGGGDQLEGLAEGPVTFGGLDLTGSGALISKLTVRACDDFGVFLHGTGTIKSCTVELCNLFGIAVITPAPDAAEVTSILKNKVSLCRGGGITCLNGPLDIQKNTCDRNGQWGINVDIEGKALEGPSITPTIVRSNTCTASRDIEGQGTGYGLALIDKIGVGLVVEKNKLIGNSIGMGIEGFSLHVASNTIEHSGTMGVVVLGSDCEVSGNTVRDNGNFGLFVSASPDDRDGEAHNEVSDNVLQDNGGDGIRIVSGANSVHDNTCKDNLGDGLQIAALQLGAAPTGNEVAGNTCMGNAHDGLDNWALLTLLTDNVCKKNGGADLAGVGNGDGTLDVASTGNVSADGTGLLSSQELELDVDIP